VASSIKRLRTWYILATARPSPARDSRMIGMSDVGQGPSSRTALAFASLCPFFPQTRARGQASAHVRKVPNPTLSEGRCCAIAADAPRTTLERSVGLLDGDDEDLGAGLEICSVPQFVNDDGRIGRHQDFLFTVLVF
jgi:hypothetical protein